MGTRLEEGEGFCVPLFGASHFSVEEASDILGMVNSISLQLLLSLDWVGHVGEGNSLCFPTEACLRHTGIFCCGLT